MCLIKPFSGAIVLCGTTKWGRAAARAEGHRRGQRDRVPPGPGNPTDGFHYNVSMLKYLESISVWGQQQPVRFGSFTFCTCILFFDWLKRQEFQNLWVGYVLLDSVTNIIYCIFTVYLDCHNTPTTVTCITPHLHKEKLICGNFTSSLPVLSVGVIGRIMRGKWNFFWLKQSGKLLMVICGAINTNIKAFYLDILWRLPSWHWDLAGELC